MMENKYDEETLKTMAVVVSDIIAERERQGLSQSELAEKAGIKQSALSRMESLRAMPQLDTLCKICRPLGLRLSVKQINRLKESETMLLSKTDVKKLKVDVISCNLSITMSNDSDFHMSSDREEEFIFEKTEDSIHIKQKKRTVLKWFLNWIPFDIKITVPAGFMGDVEIENNNGRTEIYSINLGEVNLKNGNGGISLEDMNATNLFVNNGNGRVSIKNAGFDSLDTHSANGRIQLSDIKCEGALKAKTSNGRIIAKNCKASSSTFKSSNGAILIADTDGGDMTISTSNGKVIASLLGNEADYAIDFSTSVGSIYLGNKKTHGRYVVKSNGTKLEAHTSNGKIRFRFADTPGPDEEAAQLYAEIEEAFSTILNDENENL